MTRPDDVIAAAELGAQYVGVILAGGLRHQTVEGAARVLQHAPAGVKRVGVVSDQSPAEIATLVRALDLDVVQLHADPSARRVREVRAATGVDAWAVLRIAGSTIPADFGDVAGESNAIVLDARVPGGLGGSGVPLSWHELAEALKPWRAGVHLVLAGGLRAENVEDAIAAIEPDIVDVSSGIEASPGIKDHSRMRAFRDAVQRAGVSDSR